MDDVERLKQDVREGRIPAERLVELVVRLQHELQAARRRIEELEKRLGGSATVKFGEPFSLRAEEQRQEARGKKQRKRNRPRRRGRITTADKIAQAQRTEKVFPVGVAQSDYKLSHTRPVWRLEQGQAVLVAYEIYRGPRSQYGQIPGVLGRSEFGIEIAGTTRSGVGHRLSGLYHRAVVRQSLPANELLSEPAAEKVAGQRALASVGAAVGKRVRGALHAAGKFGRRAYRRNELEPE
jgi:hypothetical protein